MLNCVGRRQLKTRLPKRAEKKKLLKLLKGSRKRRLTTSSRVNKLPATGKSWLVLGAGFPHVLAVTAVRRGNESGLLPLLVSPKRYYWSLDCMTAFLNRQSAK